MSIPNGFRLACAFNVAGVLIASKCFTNSLLSALDPSVFSRPGLVALLLWGLAYAAVARSYRSVPFLVCIFFFEKMLYTATWLSWLAQHGSTLPSLFSESPLTATVYALYGAGDFAFGLFFLWVAIRARRAARDATLP